mmetsp:Transcript_2450/g.5824  ORF Transcript_2450/g.5824 Transcript_2450/m.5824 type:complete len:366 (+) Transcript_2450:426-1523(+)
MEVFAPRSSQGSTTKGSTKARKKPKIGISSASPRPSNASTCCLTVEGKAKVISGVHATRRSTRRASTRSEREVGQRKPSLMPSSPISTASRHLCISFPRAQTGGCLCCCCCCCLCCCCCCCCCCWCSCTATCIGRAPLCCARVAIRKGILSDDGLVVAAAAAAVVAAAVVVATPAPAPAPPVEGARSAQRTKTEPSKSSTNLAVLTFWEVLTAASSLEIRLGAILTSPRGSVGNFAVGCTASRAALLGKDKSDTNCPTKAFSKSCKVIRCVLQMSAKIFGSNSSSSRAFPRRFWDQPIRVLPEGQFCSSLSNKSPFLTSTLTSFDKTAPAGFLLLSAKAAFLAVFVVVVAAACAAVAAVVVAVVG